MRVVDASRKPLIETKVEAGDIWRARQTKDIAIKDWVKLAVTRSRATGAPAVFWLDEKRAHFYLALYGPEPSPPKPKTKSSRQSSASSPRP